MKQQLSDTEADIECVYDEFSILSINQEKNGDLILETMEWDENVRFFWHAFTVFNPAGSQQHLGLFYFFLRLLQKDYAPERRVGLPPDIRHCDTKILRNERNDTLSFYFAKGSDLIGIASRGNTTVWLSQPDDQITKDMKKAVLSL